MQAVYRVLYRIGVTPWDGPGIPAPLMAEAGSAQPGIAVDLGCGTGHQARYLASRGWSVTAVDYLTEVIVAARSRDLDGTVTWSVADVTDPAAVDPGGRLSGSATAGGRLRCPRPAGTATSEAEAVAGCAPP